MSTTVTVNYLDDARTQIVASIPDRAGDPVVVGTATRVRIGQWSIVVGHGERRAYRRRGAIRLLNRRVGEALAQRAISRANLDTYRLGFDDRMRTARGWR